MQGNRQVVTAATAGKQLATGQGAVYSASVAAGSANAVLTLYDGTSSAGDVVLVLNALASDSRQRTYARGIGYFKGLFAVLTGTGANADCEV